MNHPDLEQLMTADNSVIDHLETCPRCRDSLNTDVDLNHVWHGIVDGIDVPLLVAPAARASRGWIAGAIAAAAVAALLLPAGFALLTGSEADVADGSSPEPAIVEAPVVSPEQPPEAVDEGATALPAPPDSLAYEMTFSVGSDIRGRLIWARPDYFESLRVTIDPDTGPAFDYKLYRAGDGTGYGDPDESSLAWAFGDGTTLETSLETVGATPYVPDPDVPWEVLIPGDLTGVLETLGLTSEHRADPTHPLADDAWDDGQTRLEATEDGIPVFVDRGDGPPFTVDHLDRRMLFQGEVGNNADIPVEYALYRAPLTTPEQRLVLADGIVTLGDYRAAAEAAAECAGIETPPFDDDTKLFAFLDSASECVSTWMSDIETVWRLDAQLVDSDEQVSLYYEARGESDAAEVFRSEQGPDRPLASGDGWAIAISQRGPGYCTRTSVEGSYGDGCFAVSQMPIPGVLSLDGGASYTDGKIDRGRMLGIVHQDAVQIDVTFSSGITETLVPGNVTEFGFRGFGLVYDAALLGVPVRYEIGGLAGLPNTYETGFCEGHHEFALPEADQADVCP